MISTDKPPVLYPVGTRVLTRDAGPATVTGVMTTLKVHRPDGIVDTTDCEQVGLNKQYVEPHYFVAYERPDMHGNPMAGWRSGRFLHPFPGENGGGAA